MSGDKDKKECSLHNLLLISVIKQNRKFMKDFFIYIKDGVMLDNLLTCMVLFLFVSQYVLSKDIKFMQPRFSNL